jgi:hypothetical protein
MFGPVAVKVCRINDTRSRKFSTSIVVNSKIDMRNAKSRTERAR